jgi:hypothetical protein
MTTKTSKTKSNTSVTLTVPQLMQYIDRVDQNDRMTFLKLVEKGMIVRKTFFASIGVEIASKKKKTTSSNCIQNN